MKIKTLIIDDQEEVIDILSDLVKEHCKDLEISGTASDPLEAMKMIETLSPELIFLDIKMPGLSGFELLKKATRNFDVVIISAHKEYGPEAYSNGAIHYLLKPFEVDKLIEAVERVCEKKASADPDVVISKGRIRIPDSEGFYVVPIADIIRFQASGNYTEVFTVKGQYMTTKTLGIYEVKLKGYDFIRVHNKHLINSNYVVRYIKGKSGIAVMSDDTCIDISRRKKDEFLKSI
ncbi:LytR/AlgR family response regulator transcription factor [Sporocytophaga myxococcoides]|uniref:LytR/AlgR family response regulator transcription factor n=1 Tax=Sporocytophaga myxococcoides TaxID=153721 RepID=UPI000405B225|nr:LytTR family DNA-binding domain-containing protein [Sporocytophaga myxococcoides]